MNDINEIVKEMRERKLATKEMLENKAKENKAEDIFGGKLKAFFDQFKS